MFLSQSTDFLDILYYETDISPFSSVLFYSVVSSLCNGTVDGDADDVGSFEFNNGAVIYHAK